MHRTSTLVLGIGVAFARSNSWNGLVVVSLLPKSVPFHRSRHAQRLFFQDAPQSLNHSLTRHLLIYQRSIRGCSKKILGDLTLRIPTETVRSTARTCTLRFYVENKPPKLFDFRSALPCGYPSPEVSCMIFFLLLKYFLSKFYHFRKANFRSAAPACIMCINPTNRMRGHDEARRREASVQSSRPEVGRSIYIWAAPCENPASVNFGQNWDCCIFRLLDMSRTYWKNFMKIPPQMVVVQYIKVCTVHWQCCDEVVANKFTDWAVYDEQAHTIFWKNSSAVIQLVSTQKKWIKLDVPDVEQVHLPCDLLDIIRIVF